MLNWGLFWLSFASNISSDALWLNMTHLFVESKLHHKIYGFIMQTSWFKQTSSKPYYINYRIYTNKTLAYYLYLWIGNFIWRLHYYLRVLMRSLKYGLVCDLFRCKESTQIINSLTVARKHIFLSKGKNSGGQFYLQKSGEYITNKNIIPQCIIVNSQIENSLAFYFWTTIDKCSECWRLTLNFWLCNEVDLFTFYCRSWWSE